MTQIPPDLPHKASDDATSAASDDYGRGFAAGYLRAIDLLRTEARQAGSAPLRRVALDSAADYLEGAP